MSVLSRVLHPRFAAFFLWCAAPCALLAFLWLSAAGQETSTPPTTASPLAAHGYRETIGAAGGYVQDIACRSCHTDLYDAYQEVGMARSFFKPRADTVIEDFTNGRFLHEPSGRHYQMSFQNGQYLFKRWEEDAQGKPINVFETQVDWVLGSGNHSRTYLYRARPDGSGDAGPGAREGELFLLPLVWYTQTQSWGMAPGYDRPEHQGLLRRVRRECMFCHNGYPEVPEGSDRFWSPQDHPARLPEGTGCQRCHGPGAEHVRIGLSEGFDFKDLYGAIVNPADLPPKRRNDVCYECHLQPSVALSGVRRFGRGDYSFRPGEALTEYIVPLDVEEQGRAKEDRFEINHHPYRLEQSPCFLQSAETPNPLSCLTCHDPHRKVPVERRQEHYRNACQSCHEVDDCKLDAMTNAEELPAALRTVPAGNCITCHMQPRRTQDVIQVWMTDHRIRRQPGGEELLAPRKEEDPILVGATFMDQERAPDGDLGEIYRVSAVVRAGSFAPTQRLEALLAKTKLEAVEPYLDLARAYLKLQRWKDVDRVLDALEASSGAGQSRSLEATLPPETPLVLEWRGLAQAGQGNTEEAIASIQRSLALSPDRPEGWFNLGHLFLRSRRPQEALEYFAKAIALRNNLAPAWFHQGNALQILGRTPEAIASYRRTLELDPKFTNGYLALAQALDGAGQRQEALRYLRHGARAAAEPETVRKVLEAVEPAPPEESRDEAEDKETR